MSAVAASVIDSVRGAWRHRRVAIGVAWLAAAVGWVAVLFIPQQFEASARVFVNTSTALKPLLQGIAVDQDVDAQLGMVREQLLGRARLERVVKDADLALRANTPSDLDRIVTGLQSSIVIEARVPGTRRDSNRSGDTVYVITYRHPNRDKALQVVRSLLDAFMEDTMSGKRAGASSAQQFLTDQIRGYEERLSDAEARLAEFKKQHVGLVPGDQGDYFSRLQTEMSESKRAQAALEVAVRRRSELARQLSGEQPYRVAGGPIGSGDISAARNGSSQVGAGSDTLSRIADTQAKIEEMRLRYTDKHPDVVALQETLEQLKVRHAAELDALRRGDASAAAISGLSSNPVYQSIQLQINQVDVEIAALRGQLADHQRTEAELRRLLNTAPEVEADYARLTRDYNVEKAQYTALVERLERAKLSEDASDTGIVEFKVINPPTADSNPVSPNRTLLIASVFLGALALATAVAVGMAKFRPVFESTRVLAEDTGLPVLGSVPISWADRARAEFRRGILQTAGAIAGLTVSCVALLVLAQPAARMIARVTTG